MKVLTGGKRKDMRPVWMEDKTVKLIDQPLLPHKFRIFDCSNYEETAKAIRNMVVRGAPAIGATACYGMAQAALSASVSTFEEDMQKAAETLKASRPTAYDLFHAVDYFLNITENLGPEDVKSRAHDIADAYADRSAERCQKIGEYGDKLIKPGMKILTHCNAGALACVDWGTALAPLRVAHTSGKDIFVFVDETRPRCQGARLTAWEMVQEGIPHALIADNSAGYFMHNHEIDLVITGADRVAMNGDAANKIGTYEKAVLAKENGIPFYIAAPRTTFDKNCPSGDGIPIEERDGNEVNYVTGELDNGEVSKVRISPKETKARNPAFDVTPAKYITGYITEYGIFKSKEIPEWIK